MKRKQKIGPVRKGRKQSSNVKKDRPKVKESEVQLQAQDLRQEDAPNWTVSSLEDSILEKNYAVECLLSLGKPLSAPLPVESNRTSGSATISTQTDWSISSSIDVQRNNNYYLCDVGVQTESSTSETSFNSEFDICEGSISGTVPAVRKPVGSHFNSEQSPLQEKLTSCHGHSHKGSNDLPVENTKCETEHHVRKCARRQINFVESPLQERHEGSHTTSLDTEIENSKCGTEHAVQKQVIRQTNLEESPLHKRLKGSFESQPDVHDLPMENAQLETRHAVQSTAKRQIHFEESPLQKRHKRSCDDSLTSSHDPTIENMSELCLDDSSVPVSEMESMCHDISSGSLRSIGTQCVRAPISFHEFEKMPPKSFFFFTGITPENFLALFKFIGGDEVGSKLKYTKENGTPSKPRQSTLTTKDRLFMTLLRLRRGIPIVDIAYLFGISTGWASTVIYTWIRFLSLQLRCLSSHIFPSAQVQNKNKSLMFQKFPNLRAIIDCTEIKIQHPYDFRFQTNSYSKYKHTNTMKYLAVITCFGGICFISEGFEGRMSDKQVLLQSGFLDLLHPGDTVMCDRGFDVEADLNAIGVNLLIPPFKGKKRKHFSARECASAKSISSVRTFVEISIGKMKQYRILRGQVPNTLLPILDDIAFITSILPQMCPPFIGED